MVGLERIRTFDLSAKNALLYRTELQPRELVRAGGIEPSRSPLIRRLSYHWKKRA